MRLAAPSLHYITGLLTFKPILWRNWFSVVDGILFTKTHFFVFLICGSQRSSACNIFEQLPELILRALYACF